MRQIAQNARECLGRRPQPAALCPLPPAITRRPRPVEALVWLFRLLFVLPVGRRAREDRLGELSEWTLRDLGLLRADARAAAWGMVPLQEVLPSYPRDGGLVACPRRRCALALVRMSEAA